eukprot:CAMPEP_0184710702 /NCGR_PEP_ID=MMETSP0314-20130426/1467_1 /TAXON_ID=38298 /ORGANISM="Rhodella maculata, Strain CCMP 736" /LENGTH=68 /DNA_ID=CAMNT_0027172599 /DNA_START=46 /DNA_END=252 /DNA_ORIENTATION=+
MPSLTMPNIFEQRIEHLLTALKTTEDITERAELEVSLARLEKVAERRRLSQSRNRNRSLSAPQVALMQ